MIDPEARPRLAARARLRFDKPTQSYMLLYPERGMKLNATGSSIAQLCDGKSSVAAIVATLAQSYDKPVGEVTPEVEAFLQALVDRGLIEWALP